MSEWVGGSFTPCRHLRPSFGREHTVYSHKVLIQSSDNDYLMNETRGKPTTGHDSLLFLISGTRYFICPVISAVLASNILYISHLNIKAEAYLK